MKKRIKKLRAIISYITRKLSIFTSFLKGKREEIYKVSTFFGTLSFQQHPSVILKHFSTHY